MESGIANKSPLLSLDETASYLGMSKQWCYQKLKKICAYVKIGGALKFRKEDLDHLIEKQVHIPQETRDIRSLVGLGDFHGKTVRQKK